MNFHTMNCSFTMSHPCFIEATVFPPGFCQQPLILGLLPLTLWYGRRRGGHMRHRLGRSTLAHLGRPSAIRLIYSSCIDVLILLIILQTSLPTSFSLLLWRYMEILPPLQKLSRAVPFDAAVRVVPAVQACRKKPPC